MDIAKLVRLEPGHYIIAVSGGVDSMVLMHILSALHSREAHGTRFTVAHFDHGIRSDSDYDRRLVQEMAQAYNMPFVYARGELGEGASEATAREARYEFLRKVQSQAQARAIITAHHHDDVVETAVLNLMRGSGRKGMSSLKAKSMDGIVRPLLHVPKAKLREYAQANKLKWNEDSTNHDQNYRRNYVRLSVLPKARTKSPRDYHKLTAILRRQQELNHAIDRELELLLHTQPSRSTLRRADVISLPYRVSTELVAEWLRGNGKRQLNRWLVDRLTVAARTARPDTELLLDSSSKVSFSKNLLEFKRV